MPYSPPTNCCRHSAKPQSPQEWTETIARSPSGIAVFSAKGATAPAAVRAENKWLKNERLELKERHQGMVRH